MGISCIISCPRRCFAFWVTDNACRWLRSAEAAAGDQQGLSEKTLGKAAKELSAIVGKGMVDSEPTVRSDLPSPLPSR